VGIKLCGAAVGGGTDVYYLASADEGVDLVSELTREVEEFNGPGNASS